MRAASERFVGRANWNAGACVDFADLAVVVDHRAVVVDLRAPSQRFVGGRNLTRERTLMSVILPLLFTTASLP